MEVLFSAPQFPLDEHQTTMTQLACRLVDRGYDIYGVHEAGHESTSYFSVYDLPVPDMGNPWWVRLWRYYRSWRARIDTFLDNHYPDVIVTNRRTHVPTVQGARGHEVPVVAIVEGLGFMRFNPWNWSLDKRPRFVALPPESKIQYPFVWSLFRQQRKAFSEFAAVVALSDFLKRTIAESFGVDAHVLRTMVDLESVRATDHNPEFVTMVNPRSELKGGDIFLDIARAMDEERFLVAGHFATERQSELAADLDNVTHLGWVDDMSEVYAKTKLLVVPSRVEEGGPRVIVEAFANGIPVVGTDRGGVPEFIGNAGKVVTDPDDLSQWRRKIETVLFDYDHKRSLARDRAPLFDTADTIERYERILQDLIDG